MSAPEFCDFVGAFSEDRHRLFRRCRVLAGHSPEEYLVALWLTSPEAVTSMLEQYGGKQYNSIEAETCKLHRIFGCCHSVSQVPPRSPERRRLCASSASPSLPPSVPSSPALVAAGSPRLASGAPVEVPAELLMPSSAEPCDDLTMLFPEICQQALAVGGDVAKCPVCLEPFDSDPSNYQLTELGGGVPLTILCGHTFHARCLFRWCDATCPICRFQQHPNQTSCCDVCGQSDCIHICLVCGFIGCNVAGRGHAQQHFEATRHTYALDVTTQRVWDYAGNGYVHRLLYNHEDGKVVEHSLPSAEGAMGSNGSMGMTLGADVGMALADTEAGLGGPCAAVPSEALSDFARASKGHGEVVNPKKSESVVSEFNALLASQLTAQRRYYEERIRELRAEHGRDLKNHELQHIDAEAAVEGSRQQLKDVLELTVAIEQEIAQAAAEEEVFRRQQQALEALNKKISGEQQQFESRVEEARDERRAARQRRDREVEDLQQQIRDLELFVQMRRKCEDSTDAADMQGSHLLITESSAVRGRGGRRQRRR